MIGGRATRTDPAGHRADVVVHLDDSVRARLLAGAFPGSRSVMFRFPDAAPHGDGDVFGAVIEGVHEQPDGLLRVQLLFWNDLAAIYVIPEARLEV